MLLLNRNSSQNPSKLIMNIYWSRSFPRSNSSFLLCNGIALQSSVLRCSLKEKMFLVDAGPGTPLNCMEDELTGVPINRATSHRFLMDLVAGQSQIKERAVLRFHDFWGSLDVLAGEPLLLPRRLRQNRAWIELQKNWRTNKKVKGFIINKVKGGYSVAIAGPPKVTTTKIGIVIRSFENPILKNHYLLGLTPNTLQIGLPDSRVLYTLLRSPFIDKKSREQFEMRIKKQYLVIKTERHDSLRKKFFRLKRRATRRT
ncbi:unnamed protein product (mitochondrion) [Musa banksii]